MNTSQVSPGKASEEELPLLGLRVVELQAIGPVPFAGRLLRQLGAEVTRIGSPKPPTLKLGAGPEFDVLNQGKTVLPLDLKSASGHADLRELLGTSDVLLEGFRPGVLERLDLAPQTLLQAFPRLVIGRLSGWGERGELAMRAGHDINYLALSGVLNAIGPAERPVIPLNLIADFGGGAMHLVAGVLARLVARGIHGRGGVVQSSVLGGTIGLTSMVYGFLADGSWSLARESNFLDGAPPFYRVYPTLDGKFVAVGALETQFFNALLALLGLEKQIDPESQYDRATWPSIQAQIGRALASRTRDSWAEQAAGVDCCLTPVLDWTEAARHSQNQANAYFTNTPFDCPGLVVSFPAAKRQ